MYKEICRVTLLVSVGALVGFKFKRSKIKALREFLHRIWITLGEEFWSSIWAWPGGSLESFSEPCLWGWRHRPVCFVEGGCKGAKEKGNLCVL